jgi:hypothetical protein
MPASDPHLLGYPIYPELPDRGQGGRNALRIFAAAVDTWKTQVATWVDQISPRRALIWEEPPARYGPGDIRALTPSLGDPERPWRVTTFRPTEAKIESLIPWGHLHYPTRAHALAEEGRHVSRFHHDLPLPVLTEQEIHGYLTLADLPAQGHRALFWYTVRDRQELRMRLRGTAFMPHLVFDSTDPMSRIGFTREIDSQHWAYLGLNQPTGSAEIAAP